MMGTPIEMEGGYPVVDELLTELEQAEEAMEKLDDADARDNAYVEQDKRIEKLVDEVNFDDLNQDQMIRFLALAQKMSWDIPSALMTLCSHLDDEHYFMHRPPMFGPEDGWDHADKHFEEVHGWNMNDERIDWSFDT